MLAPGLLSYSELFRAGRFSRFSSMALWRSLCCVGSPAPELALTNLNRTPSDSVGFCRILAVRCSCCSLWFEAMFISTIQEVPTTSVCPSSFWTLQKQLTFKHVQTCSSLVTVLPGKERAWQSDNHQFQDFVVSGLVSSRTTPKIRPSTASDLSQPLGEVLDFHGTFTGHLQLWSLRPSTVCY